MGKKKIKIRYIVILPVLICALIFIGKITKLNDLRAEKSDMYYRSPIQMAGVKELLYQQKHTNMTSFFRGKCYGEQTKICHG